MVAARSPSPNSSRPSNPNPNSLRKSGNFNLSKSSSNSEILQRKPFEDKENQRKLNNFKVERTKSPALNLSKGMKSFMAPTISASSKITAASPRAKILVERNQVVRDCMENNIASAEAVKGEEKREKHEIDLDSEETSGRGRSKNFDFRHLEGNRSLDSGDSDAEPSLPPYDPMKNYLSPRPRFLHYKPSPRIEQHHKFMEDSVFSVEGRRLEDSFSDSEGSEDCSGYTEPEDDDLMKTQQAQVSDQNHVFESYDPKAKLFGKFKIKALLLVLSVLLFSVPFTDSPILSRLYVKDQYFAGSLTMPFRVLQDIGLHDYVDVVSNNLQGLATRMRKWSINSIEILISFGSFSKEEQDMSHSFNMTPSSFVQNASLGFCSNSDFKLVEKEVIVNRQNDLVDYKELKFEHDKIDGETLPGDDEDVAEKLKVEFFEDVNGDRTELVKWELEEDNNPKYDLVDYKEMKFEHDKIDGETLPGDDEDVAEKLKVEFFEDVNGDRTELMKLELEEDNNPKYDRLDSFTEEDKSNQLEKLEITITEEVGDMPEKPEEQFLVELGKDEIHSINKEVIESTAYPIVKTQMTNKNNLDTFPSIFPYILLMLVVLGMLASVVLATKLISHFKKQKKNSSSSEGKHSNKKTRQVYGGTKSFKHANGDANCNRVELAEMVCDSGPTEMSSSFSKLRSKIGSHNVTPIHNVTPNHEIMERRESGASSSVSYGSFTSFERRSRKGNKQEEVMTPVRRSSRIWNQVTSP